MTLRYKYFVELKKAATELKPYHGNTFSLEWPNISLAGAKGSPPQVDALLVAVITPGDEVLLLVAGVPDSIAQHCWVFGACYYRAFLK